MAEVNWIAVSLGALGGAFVGGISSFLANLLGNQRPVKQKHGITVKTCWIAHVKDEVGLTTRKAPNRQGIGRTNPCPDDKREMILDAMRQLEML